MSKISDHPWLARYPPQVDWHATIPPMALADLLDATVARFADRPAFDFLGRQTLWRDVGQDVSRVAAGLQRAELAKGDRIGLLLPNCPAYPVVFFAAMRAGLVVVNFNPLYSARELEWQASDAGIRLLVTLDLAELYDKAASLLHGGMAPRLLICGFAAMLPPAKSLLFRLFKRHDLAQPPHDARHLWLDEMLRAETLPAPVVIDPLRDLALLQYTGGTTGTPKGAMLSHANLHANAVQGTRWFHQLRPGHERVLAALPFFHIFALTTVLLFAVVVGGEIIMLPRFVLKEAVRSIGRRRPTYFPGVPTMFNAIAGFNNVADLSSINFCISGGAPLPIELQKRFEARTGCVVVEGYGLTETSPCVCCNPPGGLNKAGSIGPPLGQTIVVLRDPEQPLVDTPRNGRGEICVRGPQVMLGYWNRPEETAASFTSDGLLRTGDLGTMDEDGYVFVVDRIKDLILCCGYNVYPRMVEDAIYRHPAVSACTVIGVPDAYRGETVKAFVVVAKNQALEANELRLFLRDLLSPIEMPKQIEFRNSLPTTLVGKLSKKELVMQEKQKARPEALPLDHDEAGES